MFVDSREMSLSDATHESSGVYGCEGPSRQVSLQAVTVYNCNECREDIDEPVDQGSVMWRFLQRTRVTKRIKE